VSPSAASSAPASASFSRRPNRSELFRTNPNQSEPQVMRPPAFSVSAFQRSQRVGLSCVVLFSAFAFVIRTIPDHSGQFQTTNWKPPPPVKNPQHFKGNISARNSGPSFQHSIIPGSHLPSARSPLTSDLCPLTSDLSPLPLPSSISHLPLRPVTTGCDWFRLVPTMSDLRQPPIASAALAAEPPITPESARPTGAYRGPSGVIGGYRGRNDNSRLAGSERQSYALFANLGRRT